MIEIQILDPQLQTLTDPHARSIQKRRTNDARLPENRGCEPLHPGSAPPASAATAEVFRSPEAGQIRAQHLAVEEQQGRQCLTMRGDRNLALVRQPGQKCPRLRCCPRLRVTHTVETDEGTNPVDISLFGW